MNIKLVSLNNYIERSLYSDKLKQFEEQFTYPLGEKSFHISHGHDGLYDYFSFFEQLGDVYYMVAEVSGIIVGAGCAVLRNINNEKVWYLCDFKIDKNYRRKGILEKMLLKYLFKFYLKAQKMYFINMSHKKENKLIKRAKNLFFIFPIKATDLYFFEWSLSEFISTGMNFDNYILLTNKNKKDIIVEQEIFNIYHLVEKHSYIDENKFQIANISDIKNQDTIMYSSMLNEAVKNLLKTKAPSTIGSFVSHRFNMKEYYSLEI